MGQATLLDIENTLSHNTRDDHQMVNTESTPSIFFAVEDGEALHSQEKKKKEWELTVAQTMNSLFQNSDLN